MEASGTRRPRDAPSPSCSSAAGGCTAISGRTWRVVGAKAETAPEPCRRSVNCTRRGADGCPDAPGNGHALCRHQQILSAVPDPAVISERSNGSLTIRIAAHRNQRGFISGPRSVTGHPSGAGGGARRSPLLFPAGALSASRRSTPPPQPGQPQATARALKRLSTSGAVVLRLMTIGQ